eukprot:CAMPEP_0204597770 /NCGR_PEP_ID=MMETSP0661-20131031/53976_1 /ASSEMBLY_ACC=CAM_ASM_000606 /TAXON_ID=109239 /ORGANISM="Alexandrium margalefi, Strain AMGDE01CS-322" /LENGTH=475 /DNA_ID=CAMNT_0051608469 /DNA_START=34 /DNA_END=1461 /DNA_ORIENTATION=+
MASVLLAALSLALARGGRSEEAAGLCSADWMDCTQSECCKGSGFRCYEKNEFFAQCRTSCTAGMEPDGLSGDRTSWTCHMRGSGSEGQGDGAEVPRGGQVRSPSALAACEAPLGRRLGSEAEWPAAPAVGGPAHPRMFCFAVVSPGTYEPELVALQYQQGSGIFGCDDYTIVSNVSAAVLFKDPHASGRIRVSVVEANLWAQLKRGPPGWDPSSPNPGRPAKHLVNAPIFVKVWDTIFSDGMFMDYDWTLKLDADTFIVPARLRTLLGFVTQLPSSPLYLQNTDADMYGNFLHGPVEALSKAAMEVYRTGAERCKKEVDYSDKGEDWYLGLCLQHLGVQGSKELRLLNDAYMWGSHHAECDAPFAAFHPFKSAEAWDRCLKQVCPTAANPWEVQAIFKYGVQPIVPTAAGVGGRIWLALPGACAAAAMLIALWAVGCRLQRSPRWVSSSADGAGTPSAGDHKPCLAGGDAAEEEC